jgi:hypothetical protein
MMYQGANMLLVLVLGYIYVAEIMLFRREYGLTMTWGIRFPYLTRCFETKPSQNIYITVNAVMQLWKSS